MCTRVNPIVVRGGNYAKPKEREQARACWPLQPLRARRAREREAARHGYRKRIGLQALVDLHLEQLEHDVEPKWRSRATKHLDAAMAFFC